MGVLCPRRDSNPGLAASVRPTSVWLPAAADLEKAVAAHCGGWDKIDGGQCTHAWSLLTGCKAQYTIRRDRKSKKYSCYGKFNPNKKEWEPHGNSPHDGSNSIWEMEWPEVGGGGSGELGEAELFERMCAWDDSNFILGAGTRAPASPLATTVLLRSL